MSSLTQNLETIYGIKQEIKEAIGTSSDIFSDYPAYISAMAGGITPTGYAYVTSNGDYDVSTYAMVNVEVSGGSGLDWDDVATAGYIIPAGSINVNANGTVDVSSYANAVVNVPIPAGYIQPSGTITIDDSVNGTTVDVSTYAYADVQISGGGSIEPNYDELNYFELVNPNNWSNEGINFGETVAGDDISSYANVSVTPLFVPDLTSIGVNPDNMGPSSYMKFYALDDSGNPVNGLFCEEYVDANGGSTNCWCLVKGTVYDNVTLKFAVNVVQWDSQEQDWIENQASPADITSFVDEYGGNTGMYIDLAANDYIEWMINYIDDYPAPTASVWVRLSTINDNYYGYVWVKLNGQNGPYFYDPNNGGGDPGY